MTTEQNQAVANPSAAINFLGLDGNAIAGLKVRVATSEGAQTFSTDEHGALPMLEITTGEQVEVAVLRQDDSYKVVDCFEHPGSCLVVTYSSPALILEAETKLHAGDPGNIAESVPRWVDSDAGAVTSNTSTAEYVPFEDGFEPTQVVIKDVPNELPAAKAGDTPPLPVTAPGVTKPATYKKPDPNLAVPTKTGANAPIVTGRNTKGEPVAVYTEKSRDWWGRWLLGTLHFLGIATENAEPKAQTTASEGANKTAVATNSNLASKKAAPSATASSAVATFDTTVAYSGSMTKQVENLIEIATELTGYEIACGTHTFLMQEKSGKKKLNEYPKKQKNDSITFCYVYVKIALMKANVIKDPPGNIPASEAGPELLKRGFTDVTSSILDPRMAAAGDVIVYAWTQAVWDMARKNDAFKAKIKEYQKNKKKIDFKLEQMSPGDSSYSNMGHIDIRSIDGYISDHLPMVGKKPNQKNGEPNWQRYDPNPRIYRKIFDPIPTLRILAFLSCLREYEAQEVSEQEKRFYLLNVPLPSNPNTKLCESLKTHPWEGLALPPKGSTAAGAYQITCGTWKEKFDQSLIAVPAGHDKFSPEVQTRIAVMKLQDRGALNNIRNGEIEAALSSTTLPKEWSSLPGGNENAKRKTADGKPMDMNYFLSLFEQYLNEEKRKVMIP